MDPTFSFESEDCLSDLRFRNFLTVTLRLHQIFALVEVDYAKAFGVSQTDRAANVAAHFQEVAAQLKANGGLKYRSGTAAEAASPTGRAFAHAADPSVLVGHLAQLGADIVSQNDTSSTIAA